FVSSNPNWLGEWTWSSPISTRVLLEAGVAYHPEVNTSLGEPGVTADRFPVTELSTGLISRASTTAYYTRDDWQYNTKFIVNYVTGSHAVKLGVQTRDGKRQHDYYSLYGGLDLSLGALNGVPTQVTVWTTPYTVIERQKAWLALFAQDQWKV